MTNIGVWIFVLPYVGYRKGRWDYITHMCKPWSPSSQGLQTLGMQTLEPCCPAFLAKACKPYCPAAHTRACRSWSSYKGLQTWEITAKINLLSEGPILLHSGNSTSPKTLPHSKPGYARNTLYDSCVPFKFPLTLHGIKNGFPPGSEWLWKKFKLMAIDHYLHHVCLLQSYHSKCQTIAQSEFVYWFWKVQECTH